MKKYIGIDVSKRDFHVCLNENGDVNHSQAKQKCRS